MFNLIQKVLLQLISPLDNVSSAEYIALLVIADLQGVEPERLDWMPEYYGTSYKGLAVLEEEFVHVEREEELEERKGWGCMIV